MEELYGEPLAVWSDWAKDLRGHRIEAGHHMAEDAHDELAGALLDFLRRRICRTPGAYCRRAEARRRGRHV